MSHSATELLVENLELRRLLAVLDPGGLLLEGRVAGATIQINLTGKITYWAPTAEAIFGFTRAEMLGSPIEMLVPLERLGETRSLLERVKDGDRHVQIITERVCKDQRRILVSWGLRPIRDRRGKLTAIAVLTDLANLQDPVQAHRRHRRALRVLTEQVSAILGTLSEGLLVADLEGHILFWNRAMSDLHGIDDRMVRRRLHQYRDEISLYTLSGKLVAIDQWPIYRILAGDDVRGVELRMRNQRLGIERIVRYSGNVVEALDEQPFMVLSASDVSALHAAELRTPVRDQPPAEAPAQAVPGMKLPERTLLDSIRGNVAVLDQEGCIVMTNAGWDRFAAVNQADGCVGIGTNYLEICQRASERGSDGAREVYEGLRDVLRGARESYTLDYPCHSPQAQRWFFLAITPLNRRQDGPPKGALVTHIDVTERVQSEVLSYQQRRVLEMTASGAPLAGAMEILVGMVEQPFQDLRCSILLLEDGRLYDLAGGSLPAAYRQAVDGTAVGEGVGSCGTAAFRRREVVVADIANDPLWADFRDLALAHGLRACWSTPIIDAEGNVIGTFAVYYTHPQWPVVEHRRVIEIATHTASVCISLARNTGALRESERRFRQVVESIQEVFWLTDVGKQHHFYVSPAYEKIWGRPLDQLRHDPTAWLEAIHPEDRPRVEHASLHRQASGEYDLEYRILRADGEERWIHEVAFPISDPDGKITRIAGVAEDITARKRAQETIQQQAALLEQTGDAIIVTDLEGHVTFWNRGAEQVYSWPRDLAIGRPIATLIDSAPADFLAMREAVLRNGHWNGEMVRRTRDGRLLTIAARWTLLRDESGRAKAILSIETDVTDTRMLEAAYLRSQRIESIGTIAGGIAHDLNNTLAPILIAVDLLRPKLEGTEDGALIAMLEDGVRSSAELVRHILTFSRGSDGPRRAVAPSQLVADVARILHTTLLKQIAVETHLAEEVPAVAADPTQLHQILLNLCVNARDAMPRGGKLSISVAPATPEEISAARLPAEHGRRYVHFRVSDTGTGIPEEIRDRIFEPFFTTKGPQHGTGLGLATVHRIVRGHGGAIDFTTEMGRGTTFRILLPVAEAPGRVAEEVGVLPLPRGNGQRVLVVDDEASLREINRQMLEASGFKVITAANGEEALAVFAERGREIDAVVTDLMMPGVDGLSLIARLRHVAPRLPLIAMTGLGTDEQRAAAVRAGADHFLLKPYTARSLLTLLNDSLVAAAIAAQW